MFSFSDFLYIKENSDSLDQPHVISADPPIKIPEGLKRIVEAFKKSKEVPIAKEIDSKNDGEKFVTLKSKKLYLVGGAVRDYLLNRTPKNYNLVTDAHPDEIEKICTHHKPPIHIAKKDSKNGKVRVNVGGNSYIIETMKSGENTYTTDLARDSSRRDLTVNSLYYDLTNNKIYDFHGGLRDIKNGNIKFIGNAEDKLKEDPIRAFRYAKMMNYIPNAQENGDIENMISKRMKSSDDIAPSTIRDEFWEGLENLHTNAKKYIESYAKLGLLEKVFPGLILNLDFKECKTCKSKPIVLSSLLKDNSPKEVANKLKSFGFGDREIRETLFLLNLLHAEPNNYEMFKNKLLLTGLTKRQIQDWVKINDLDTKILEFIY